MSSAEAPRSAAISRRCARCGKLVQAEQSHACVDAQGNPVQIVGPVTSGDDLIGALIGERYEVQKRISAGGMGVVYKARHILLDNEVAVKILLKPEDPDAQFRFLQEAQLASKINHPNTVHIYDFGLLPDERSYIVMELLRGSTLGELILGGPLEPLRALSIAAQVARGLQAVHDKGIIHRDLKPDNIFLLAQDGLADFVKIVDFGIATSRGQPGAAVDLTKALAEAPLSASAQMLKERRTLPGMVLGTPQYMSPEQAQGLDLDPRADQYALGCILFEMLAGTVPYDDDNVVAILFAHCTAKVPALAARRPGLVVPPAVEQIMLRTLAKQPGDRFPSMRELEQALEEEITRLSAELGVQPRRPTLSGIKMLPEGTVPRGRTTLVGIAAASRRPWLVVGGVLGTVLVLGVGGGIVGYELWQRQQAARRAALAGEDAAQTRRLIELRDAALAELRTQLGGTDAELRAGAVGALGETRDAALAPSLVPLLKDVEPRVQIKGAEALGSLGRRDVTAALLPLLEDASRPPGVTVAAGAALDQLGEPRGRAYLQKLLRARPGDGRSEAARLYAALYLCGTGDQEALRLLSTAVQRSKVAEDGLVSILPKLAQAGDEDARERLTVRLRSAPSREAQWSAASALVKLGDDGARDFLRGEARRPGPDQLRAGYLLATLDEPVEAERFRQVVQNTAAQPAARALALVGLGYAGERSDGEVLLARLKGEALPQLRQAAAIGILRLTGSDPAILAMQNLSWAEGALAAQGEGGWLLRDQAVAVLGDVDAPSSVQLLGKALQSDSDATVRRSAARALGQKNEKSALVALRGGIGDKDAGVRTEVLRSIGSVGRKLVQRGQDVRSEVSGWLDGVVKGPGTTDALLARATLVKIGDEGQRAQLKAALAQGDVAARAAFIEGAGRESVDLLVDSLRDPAPDLRAAAARRLGELGDKRAIPVLRELLASQPATAAGLGAYALLRKLGEPVALPGEALGLAEKSTDATTRAAALEARVAPGGPAAERALEQGARDANRGVRLRAAELAAPLPGAASLTVLRQLTRDADATVRSRASALLGQRLKADAAKAAEAKAADAKPKTDTKPQPPAPATPASPPDLGTAAAPIPATPATPATPEPAAPAPAGGGGVIEDLLRAGSEAFSRKDYRKAQKSLERAGTLCAREPSRTCTQRAFDLSYLLGRTYEAQGQWVEAMNEFQKLDRAKGGKGSERAYVTAATGRLSQRLGRLVVSEQRRGRCTVTLDMWMAPGEHDVRIDGKTQSVQVLPRKTTQAGTCK